MIKYTIGAKYVENINLNYHGSYSSWLSNIVYFLSLKEEFLDTVFKNISRGDPKDQRFVLQYYGSRIEDSHNLTNRNLSELIRKELSKENQIIYNYVNDFIQSDQLKEEVKKSMSRFSVCF